jgi:hypothetical protein
MANLSNTILIPLTQGLSAIIDEDDHWLFKEESWFAHWNSTKTLVYAKKKIAIG